MRRRNEVHAQAVRWLRLASQRGQGWRKWYIGDTAICLQCNWPTPRSSDGQGTDVEADAWRAELRALLCAAEAYAAAGGKR